MLLNAFLLTVDLLLDRLVPAFLRLFMFSYKLILKFYVTFSFRYQDCEALVL
jgi:hypothetical protein